MHSACKQLTARAVGAKDGTLAARMAPMLESLHWEYRGEEDTSTWGENYLTCSAGMEQTPINIESEVMHTLHAHVRSRTRIHIHLQK